MHRLQSSRRARALRELLQTPKRAWRWGFVGATSRTGVRKGSALCPTSPMGTRGWGAAGARGPTDPVPTPSSACPGFVLCTATVCAAPTQQSSSVPPTLNRQEEKKSLAGHVFSNFCTSVETGDAGPGGDATAMCFPGTASPLGFLTSLFTELFHYFSASQLITLRTRFPAGEVYVRTLDIAAAWYGFSRMKSFGKTPKLAASSVVRIAN